MELSFNFTQKTFSINFVLVLQTLLSVTDSWHSLKAVTEVFKRFSSQVALDFPDSSARWHAGERAAWLCSVTAGPQLSLAVGVVPKGHSFTFHLADPHRSADSDSTELPCCFTMLAVFLVWLLRLSPDMSRPCGINSTAVCLGWPEDF